MILILIITPDELVLLVEEGLLSDLNNVYVICDLGNRVLCLTCSPHCMVCTGPGDSDFNCRVPLAVMLNPTPTQGSMMKVEPHHSE